MSLAAEERYGGALHLLAQESEGILSKRKRDANYRNKLKISLRSLDSVLPPPGSDIERNYNRILEDAFALITHLEGRFSALLSQARNRCQSFKINYALLTLTMTRTAYAKTLTEIGLQDVEECAPQSVEERVQIKAKEYFSTILPVECLQGKQVQKNEDIKETLDVALSLRNTGASWKPFCEADEIDVVSLDSTFGVSYISKPPCENDAIDLSLKGPQEGHLPGISTPRKNAEHLSQMLAHRPFKSKQLTISTCTPEASVYTSPKSRSKTPTNVSRSAIKGKACQGKKRLNFSRISEDSPFTSIKRKRNDESLHVQKSYPSRMGKRRKGRGKNQTFSKSMNYSGDYSSRKNYNSIDSDKEGKICDRKSPQFEDVVRRKNGTTVTIKKNRHYVPQLSQSWQMKKENILPLDLTHTFMPTTSTNLFPTLPVVLNKNETNSAETAEFVFDELKEIEISSLSSGRCITADNNNHGLSNGISSHSPGTHSPRRGGINIIREDNGMHLNSANAFYPLSELARVFSDQDCSSDNSVVLSSSNLSLSPGGEESSYLQVASAKNCEGHSFVSPLPGLRASYHVLCAPRKIRRMSFIQGSPQCRRNLTRTFQTVSPHTSCVKWHDTPPDSPWRREQMLPQMDFDSD